MAHDPKPLILLVDDEEEVLRSLRRLLQREFEVHIAKSGHEALQILEQQPVQVVLSDQRMPEMAGVELLIEAHGKRPRAIRVMFTGYADVKAVIDAINKGRIFRYLAKPWDPDELVAVMREASREYDRQAEQRRLFDDLQTYQMRCLALVEGLRSGQFGTLNEEGQEEVDEVAGIGYTLLHRFDQSFGLDAEEGGSG